MKKLIALTCLGLLIVTSVPAVAGVQQEKMRMCNKEAKEKALAGEERKAFMKSCLSKEKEGAVAAADSQAEPTPADHADKKMARHEKRKLCKKEAKEKALTGEDRKTFMKTCLGKKVDEAAADNADDVARADRKAVRQEKMKTCNASATEKALKGPERKQFMRECLKG